MGANMMQASFRKAILGVAFVAALLLPVAQSQADMLVMPPFVTFKDRERMQDIMVLNTGNKPGVFRMSWIHNKQNPDGSYTRQDAPVDPSFDPETMIVFSPKQVTLPPAERQRIRMSLRRPPDLPEGEYHAHMQLMRVRKVEELGQATGSSVGTALDVRVGLAVPVIIRHGTWDAKVTISDPQFVLPEPGAKNPRARLKVMLSRSGKFGTYGTMRAYWTPPGGRKEQEVATLNNVSIYPETTQRSAWLVVKPGVQIVGGTLRVVYEGMGIDYGKVFDEKTFPVGG